MILTEVYLALKPLLFVLSTLCPQLFPNNK